MTALLADTERVSVCCAAPEHPDVPEFCSACNVGTSFEPAADASPLDAMTLVERLTANNEELTHSLAILSESKRAVVRELTKAQGERDALREVAELLVVQACDSFGGVTVPGYIVDKARSALEVTL